MPKRSRNSVFPAFLSIELFSDCVDTGFDALHAVLINSRTGQAMAHCKAYFCYDSCCLQDFDAECDDLATIADRLVRVALPKKKCPGEYVFASIPCFSVVLE